MSTLVHFFEDGRWGSPGKTGVEGQSLTAEDQLFVLTQAGLYLTVTRGLGVPEARICYERAEPLCRSLNHQPLIYLALIERTEERWCSAELHRLRGVFLAALGAEEAAIEASFHEAIRIAREQKSVSLEKRAEATYAVYRRRKANASGGRRFRLPRTKRTEPGRD